MSTLYIVATPLGNLGDITLRAIETFQKVDLIVAEDTRHTLQLLNHLHIKKPLLSCHCQNEKIASAKIIALLKEGKNIAYVSDAGTPAVSDPGAVLVSLVREAGFNISPIPGACAFVTLVSVAGIIGKTFIMEGFLSVKAGKRRARLKELLDTGECFILYESPYRIVKLLKDIADMESTRCIVVGRELTKIHEEILLGSAEKLYEDFASRNKIQGEFVVLIQNAKSIKLSNKYCR